MCTYTHTCMYIYPLKNNNKKWGVQQIKRKQRTKARHKEQKQKHRTTK